MRFVHHHIAGTGCSHRIHCAIMTGLDELSRWLKSDTYLGYAVIFTLIFVTTFRKCQIPSFAINRRAQLAKELYC